MSEAALEVTGLSVEYHRHMPVVNDFAIGLKTGEVVGLFGRNGAGKSTSMRAIFGLVPKLRGEIRILGHPIESGMRTNRIASLGATMVMEGRGIFGDLSVEENLRSAARGTGSRQRVEAALERFPALATRRATLAGRLSGGEQQLLAVARAAILQPRLLLIDEPSLGLSPAATDVVLQALRQLALEGSAILVADQNVLAVGKICDRAAVMDGGKIVAQMNRDELIDNPEWVEDIYLGKRMN
jgi:branched-chain amino acid transport system ATP-binding protein